MPAEPVDSVDRGRIIRRNLNDVVNVRAVLQGTSSRDMARGICTQMGRSLSPCTEVSDLTQGSTVSHSILRTALERFQPSCLANDGD